MSPGVSILMPVATSTKSRFTFATGAPPVAVTRPVTCIPITMVTSMTVSVSMTSRAVTGMYGGNPGATARHSRSNSPVGNTTS